MNHRTTIRALRGSLFAVALAFWATSVFAQTSSTGPGGRAQGLVSGRVLNQATGQYLGGAFIAVEGTNVTARTVAGGEFTLSAPVGPQTLRVEYAGLDTQQVSVMIPETGRATVEVQLTSQIYKLEAFTVEGIREGAALAVQRQREAENAKTVVAADAHGAPATNPGELLSRIPGIAVDNVSDIGAIFVRGLGADFISVMVDGNDVATANVGAGSSRNPSMRALSTANVESVELVRAPTPDMPANAVGGQVNMVSRRGFDRRERLTEFTFGSRSIFRPGMEGPRYRDQFALDQVVFRYGDAFSVAGGERNLGVDFTVSHNESFFSSNGLANSAASYLFPTAANGLPSTLQHSFAVQEFADRPVRLRTVGLNLDYRLSDRTSVYWRNTLNENGHTGVAGNVTWTMSTAASPASFAPGSTYDQQTALPLASSRSTLLSSRGERLDSSYATSAGISHRLFNDESGLLEADVNFSNIESDGRIGSNVSAEATGVGWSLDRRGAPGWFPRIAQTAGPSINDPASYRLTTRFDTDNVVESERRGARVNFRKDLNLAVPAYIKTGVRYDLNEVEVDNYRVNYTYIANGATGIASFMDPERLKYRLTNGNYGPFPFPVQPTTGGNGDVATRPELWRQTAADAYNDVLQSKSSDSVFEETIAAAYLQSGVTLGKLRVMGGVRVERTDAEGRAFQTSASAAAGTSSIPTLTPEENRARANKRFAVPMRTVGTDYVDVFPGIHLVYEPNRRLQVRASYNRSISRPPIGSVLPNNTVSEDTQVVTAGNPDLQPFAADNFEVAVQRYFEPIGLLEFSVFHKDITDYFRTIESTIGSGPDNGFDGNYVGYILRQPVNTGDARIRGFEIAYQQQFSWLPGVWRGLGAFANFTYTQAEGNFGTTLFQKQLANQRPRTANAGVSYVAYGWQLRLLGNWDDRFYRSGAGASSTYADPRFILDFKGQYRISQRYELFFEAMNLTNEFVRTFVLENDIKANSLRKGIFVTAGVKVSF
jgi:iron complex outermembrane recepter protein